MPSPNPPPPTPLPLKPAATYVRSWMHPAAAPPLLLLLLLLLFLLRFFLFLALAALLVTIRHGGRPLSVRRTASIRSSAAPELIVRPLDFRRRTRSSWARSTASCGRARAEPEPVVETQHHISIMLLLLLLLLLLLVLPAAPAAGGGGGAARAACLAFAP